MRARIFLLVFLLSVWVAAVARPPAGGHGSPQPRGPQMQGQQRQGQQQQQRGGEMQQDRQRQRARLHDCQQACVRAQEQSRQMQRYADRENFDPATAQQFGRQLQEHLGVMNREHSRLRERLTAEEQERNRDRLRTMDQAQQRWQENWQALEGELEREHPNPQALRRRARSIEKEVKNYRKELDRLESSLEP